MQVTWKEEEDGSYIPSIRYTDYINVDDGTQFNSIDWKNIKMLKKNLTKTKRETMKPKDIAYHKKHGYVYLEKDNSIVIAGEEQQTANEKVDKAALERKRKTWECMVISRNEDGTIKAGEEGEKININVDEIEFHITIELLMYFNKRLT